MSTRITSTTRTPGSRTTTRGRTRFSRRSRPWPLVSSYSSARHPPLADGLVPDVSISAVCVIVDVIERMDELAQRNLVMESAGGLGDAVERVSPRLAGRQGPAGER